MEYDTELTMNQLYLHSTRRTNLANIVLSKSAYNFIYIMFKNRQNSSVVLEVSMGLPLWGGE